MVSDSVTHGSADTSSEAWGQSEGWGQGYAQSLARSQALSQAMMHGVTTGLSTGLMPGINIGRSWQTEDDVADRLTEVLRKLEGLVNTASAEGGFMANALIFTEFDGWSFRRGCPGSAGLPWAGRGHPDPDHRPARRR